MRPLQPTLSRKESLTEHATSILRAFRTLRVPSTRQRLRAVGKGVLVKDEPFAAAGDATGFGINHIDEMGGRILLMGGPADFRVEGFVFYAVFCGVAAYGVNGGEYWAVDCGGGATGEISLKLYYCTGMGG